MRTLLGIFCVLDFVFAILNIHYGNNSVGLLCAGAGLFALFTLSRT